MTHLHGGFNISNIYIKIEKNSTFNIFLKQTELINLKKNGLMLRRQWMADYLWIYVIISCFLYSKLLVWKQNICFNNTPKTIKLVCVASPPSTQHYGERTYTGWLGIRIMCQSGATGLPADCCFSELTLYKPNSACWSSAKRTSSSFHWKLACSRHDIAEKLVNWP
jgi:hypothetical protein